MEILEYLLSYFHNKTVDDINSKIFPSSIALLHRKFIELQWTRALHAFPPTSYLSYVSCVSHPSKFTKCNITWITHSLASKSSLRYTISLIFFVKEGEIYDFINSLFNRAFHLKCLLLRSFLCFDWSTVHVDIHQGMCLVRYIRERSRSRPRILYFITNFIRKPEISTAAAKLWARSSAFWHFRSASSSCFVIYVVNRHALRVMRLPRLPRRPARVEHDLPCQDAWGERRAVECRRKREIR